MNLAEFTGDIDIYLFDQILKNRFRKPLRILDAGCGGGRNLVYFLRAGFDVFGVDQSPDAVEAVRSLAHSLAPELSPENFRVAAVEKLPFGDAKFGAVISSAVFHFAEDETQFDSMLAEMWRVLAPGGMFFARLASDIGIEMLVEPRGGRRFLLPDGSERFLVNHEMLFDAAARLGARQIEPIKTTNVQNLRAMTTWVLEKAN
jgi:SAM-dependent methyltransferase